MEVIQSKEPIQGAKADQKPEIDPATIDELTDEELSAARGHDWAWRDPGTATKRVYERILGAEMTHYLGYEKGQVPSRG